jgi:hypothetical protein
VADDQKLDSKWQDWFGKLKSAKASMAFPFVDCFAFFRKSLSHLHRRPRRKRTPFVFSVEDDY